MATGEAYSVIVPQGYNFVEINKISGNSVLIGEEIVSAKVQKFTSKQADYSIIDEKNIPQALLEFLSDKGYGLSCKDQKNEINYVDMTYTQIVNNRNMGDFSWSWDSSSSRFQCDATDAPDKAYGFNNILPARYSIPNSQSASDFKNGMIKGFSNNRRITIKDSSFTGDAEGAAALKASLDGVMINYIMTEPIVYDISEYLSGFDNRLQVEYGGTLTFSQQSIETNLPVGYDINWVSYTPHLFNYTDVKLTNGIFDHWYVTNDVTSPYSSLIPMWDAKTIMNANFNRNILAGNVSAKLKQIDGFLIKRRKSDEFDWVDIKYIPKEELRNYSFSFNDNLLQNNQEYEYAVVPISSGAEGEYIVNSIKSKFNGVFIADADRIYRFLTGVSYGETTRNQKVGVFEPYGRKYPVIISNGEINYNTGSISGTVLNNDYLETRHLDRDAIRKEAKYLVDFLTNKKAKIIKDWNGNIWLVAFTGNPQTSYADGSGMGLLNVSAEWIEIGDANKQADLLATGMIKGVG